LLDDINKEKSPLQLNSTIQNYYKPFWLKDALSLKKIHPGAIIVSGATDTALRQTKRRELLPEILDISAIDSLNYFVEEDQIIKIGSGLSLEKLKNFSENNLPALHQMLKIFGSLQIRNLATIGGNVGSASPIGDTLPLLIAYKAYIKLQSEITERMVWIEDFILGYRKTDIRPDELITSVHIPKPDSGTQIRSFKISKRKDLDISTVSGAFSLKLENGNVREIILAYGGMADKPKRARNTEKFLYGKPWTRSTVENAMEVLIAEFTPLSDARAGAGYRTLVAGNLLLKFFVETSTPSL
jgi:xanthine dehydrogenase small subunit